MAGNIVDIIIKGTDKSSKALRAPIKNIGDLKTAVGTLGPAFKIGVGVAVASLGALVFKAVQTAEETAKMSQMIGVSTEALSTLSFASELAGTDVEVLKKSMQRLSVQVLDAGRGLKEAQDNFKALGLNVRDANGDLKDTETLFKEAATSISKLPDGLEKAGLAQKVFGKSGAQLIPLLNQGAEGIEKMQDKARALGLELDSNTAKEAEEFIDTIAIFKGSIQGLGLSIAKDLLPGLNAMADGMRGAEGQATGVQVVLNALVSVVGFVGKSILSIFEGVSAVLDVFASSIASIGAKIVAVFTGDIAGIKAQDEAFKQGLVDTVENASKNIDAIWSDHRKRKLAEDTKQAKAEVVLAKKTGKQIEDEAKRANDKVIALARERASATQAIANNTFGALKSLAGENAIASKAIAIGQATINAYLSITKTLGDGGAFAVPLAISTGVLAFANVAKIASTPLGFEQGGIVPGQSFTGDKIMAGLNSQELVMNVAQSENVAETLKTLGGGGGGRFIGTVDGRVLLDFVSDSSKNGQLEIAGSSIV